MSARRPLSAGLLGLLLVSCDAGLEPVVPIPTTVTLEVSSLSFATLGRTRQIAATIRDQSGEPIGGAERTWTSFDESVATVSATGLVTAVGNGSTIISVTSGTTASAFVSVTVRQIAASITLSRDAWSFSSLADTMRLSAAVADAGGSEIADAVVEWSSIDSLVASVSITGLVTARSNGTTAVTAVSDGVVEAATVIVDQIPGAIAISADSVLFDALGDTASLAVMVTDASGFDVGGADITWTSSDVGVATVSASGRVTAVGNGVATVTATAGLVVQDATVTVAQAVALVTLSPDSLVFRDPGDSAPLSASVRDPLGSEVAGAVVAWTSSDAGVATVTATGLVNAVATGIASISAAVGAYSASVPVRVEPELALVALGPSGVSAQVAADVSLSARVEDVLGAAYAGATVTWSVDAGAGTITSAVDAVSDATGYVGAVWSLGTSAGTQRAFASLTSRGNILTVEFVASATPGPAMSASLIADSVLLSARGETVFLGPTYADEYGNPTTGTGVTWSSSDQSVATVAPDGLVTGVGTGATYVTASLGAPVDSILVTVQMRGAITITFDDGWRTTYDNAWPVFQEFGLPANVAVYTGAVGFPAYMDETNLAELSAAGWSMVSHTVRHDSLTTLSVAEVDYELRASQQWILDRGYSGSNVFVAPYHEFGPAERVAAASYYTAARGASANVVVPDTLVQWMPSNPYLLTGLEADNLPYTSVAGRNRLRAVLQRTLDEGVFVDLFFHRVPPQNVAALRETLIIVQEFRDRVLPYGELYPVWARPVG